MAQDSIFHGSCTTGQTAAAMVACKQQGRKWQPLVFSTGPQRTVLTAKPVAYADVQVPSQRRVRG
jgi:hypothetical protein